MFRKVLIVFGIVVIVTVSYFILTASMPAITEMTGVAANTSNIENYSGAKEAVQSAPIWLYAIPAIVGGIAIVITLRS